MFVSSRLPVLGAGLLIATVFGLLLAPAYAQPETVDFDIPAQSLDEALIQFGQQSRQELFYEDDDVIGLTSNPVVGEMTRAEAMRQLLRDTGLEFEQTASGGMMIGTRATLNAQRADSALAGQNTPESRIGQRRKGIEEIIVTGQKREERIQDVPIAITAFTQEDLTTQQIAGGPDLITQVPNMTFTKTNFTGYSIQLRGIGTQAISATTDPAVAVALNQTPFIRNRFFEQEFYDMERVEVLRGPQGTLFGRNATAGVVNLITNKPQFQKESMISLDKGNYDSRRWEFMLNTPLVEDKVALRIAAAGTKRDGYAINELTDNPIDGRDLWSSRVSLRFVPNDRLDINLLWEHFEEDDERLRSGKQLCKTEEVTEIAGVPTTHFQTLFDTGQGGVLYNGVQGTFSQGCERNSLYASDSFQTPNGIMLPYYVPLGFLGLPIALDDPYVSRLQSRDLRVIESTVDPEYRAKSDIGEIQVSYQLTDTLTLDSETAYLKDFIFSLQDFNRFSTASGAWDPTDSPVVTDRNVLSEDGVYCDHQIGCADRLVAVGLSTAESRQFSQEFRLSSQFSGPFNFSLGVNYLRYDTEDKYYVFANSLSMIAALASNLVGGAGSASNMPPYVPGESTNAECLNRGFLPRTPGDLSLGVGGCIYMDTGSFDNLNDLGHQYFLSKNPFRLNSYGIFGESYWNITDTLKLTAGLRWSVDEKTAPLHPTWLFVPNSVGYPVSETIEQEWREPTGRLVLDWKPQLDFTDETLIYGSLARGYKAGGANPPLYVGPQTTGSLTRPQTFDAEFVNAFEIGTKNTLLDGAMTFNMAAFYYDYKDYQISEIVDRSAFNKNYDAEVWGGELETDWWARENLRLSFKLGYTKTRIADGEKAIDLMDRTAGGTHFFITDARNPNFVDPDDPDAPAGTPEPLPRSEYVAGHSWNDIPDNQEFFAFDQWQVSRPFPTYPSNCIMPEFLYVDTNPDNGRELTNVGAGSGAGVTGCDLAYVERGPSPVTQAKLDPVTWLPYTPNPTEIGTGGSLGLSHEIGIYPGYDPAIAPNNGEGFAKDLGGNELPNAPNYTATLSGDYIVPLTPNWAMTLHTDLHWQSKSWWRIFNDHEYNRLDDYFTMNLAAIFTNEVDGWNIMAYIKNVTNETAITGGFLGSDDTGLTTNVFLTEPRLYGLRVTKHWGGGGPAEWLGGAGAALLGKKPGEPTPWELTVGGQLLRPDDAPAETYMPEFISEFDPDIDLTGVQAGDMHWGEGREIVLTYAPDNGWRFSLGARFGNRDRKQRSSVLGETVYGCYERVAGCREPIQLYPGFPYVQYDYLSRTNYSLTEVLESEDHLIVDFTVGRDVGLGGLLEGTASAGLRYAQFESRSDVMLRGTPDWNPPEDGCWVECRYVYDIGPGGIPKYTTLTRDGTHNEYFGSMDAKREFEGVGPVASWEASSRLFGDENEGRLDLDWSVSGGVLFGKQETTVQGVAEGEFFSSPYNPGNNVNQVLADTPDATYSTPFSYKRTNETAVVPTLGASLGLTYRVNGFGISTGYNWERYYSVIDGGIEERKAYDRTIEGPYLKVTFGGGS